MFLKKEKESRVKQFEQLRPVTRASKTKNSIYTLDALWHDVSSDYKHLTPNHTISFENVLIMIHSLNRGFAVRNPYVQNMT